ncbi:glucoamylase family protein [Sphingobacterium bovistauri]|uniref:Glycoamylase-like domain-containing protein n=1 Tax=Sphingobacterium bovistauri TaxID=2781959 RepID=A0ABS7Z5Q8_9SPHI|nr:glucoamylase family protein [Sphingobacterium bovistauri]MCA5005536.1 hypothetical protein [Sphingobacterium bovistauri]
MYYLRIIILIAVLVPNKIFADTYPEVVFDNSIVKGSYAKSNVIYSGNSWVENINKHLLVSDTLFFTPGNSLSLKYLSSIDGHWTTTINYSRQKFNYTVEDTDFLSLRLFIPSTQTTANNLPKIFVRQQNAYSDTLRLADYITKLEYNKWLQIKIPIKKFNLTSSQASVLGIGFSQNGHSEKLQQVFLDQIEFLPNKYPEIPLRSAAILSEVKAYDKAVHLKWQLPLSPSIRYIKIYRSIDGKEFYPISIKTVPMQSCLDIVPRIGVKYYYKISWMDYNYQESPSSDIKEVQTTPMNDEEILKLVQLANVNYFIENFDINSGMYMPFRSKNKVIVSTEETAGAILSLIVGVKNEFISRQSALNRISKITFFLLKSQHKNGIFPAYYDARKGVPEYRNDLSIYDVKASAEIIEALLIAREYFNDKSELENDLRNRITQLYQQVNWKSLLNDSNLLTSKLALVEKNENKSNSLIGFNKSINTYLMATGKTKYAIPLDTYFDAIYHKLENIKIDTTQSLNPYYYDERIEENLDVEANSNIIDSTIKVSVFQNKIAYGVNLPFGKLSTSLLGLYKPFLTIRPSAINDSLSNWNNVLSNYLQYTKRRDNEIGVGVNNSDIWGYYKQFDNSDHYRINPAIASSSIFLDKTIGTKSIIDFYKQYGDVLLSELGFRSWIDLRDEDVSDEYTSDNQSSIAIMIENSRTGLIWDLYERIPELKQTRESLFRNKKQ